MLVLPVLVGLVSNHSTLIQVPCTNLIYNPALEVIVVRTDVVRTDVVRTCENGVECLGDIVVCFVRNL
jgi:hypothetical protein